MEKSSESKPSSGSSTITSYTFSQRLHLFLGLCSMCMMFSTRLSDKAVRIIKMKFQWVLFKNLTHCHCKCPNGGWIYDFKICSWRSHIIQRSTYRGWLLQRGRLIRHWHWWPCPLLQVAQSDATGPLHVCGVSLPLCDWFIMRSGRFPCSCPMANTFFLLLACPPWASV